MERTTPYGKEVFLRKTSRSEMGNLTKSDPTPINSTTLNYVLKDETAKSRNTRCVRDGFNSGTKEQVQEPIRTIKSTLSYLVVFPLTRFTSQSSSNGITHISRQSPTSTRRTRVNKVL